MAENTQDEEFDQEDFKQFLNIQIATGQLISENMESYSEEAQLQINADYQGWINAGRPKPQLTEKAKAKISKIISVTRVKHLGNQFLTYVEEGHDAPTGIKEELTKKDGRIIKREKIYKIKFVKDEATKLVTRCQKETVSPQFYLETAGRIFSVTPKNFTENFDALIARANKLEII